MHQIISPLCSKPFNGFPTHSVKAQVFIYHDTQALTWSEPLTPWLHLLQPILCSLSAPVITIPWLFFNMKNASPPGSLHVCSHHLGCSSSRYIHGQLPHILEILKGLLWSAYLILPNSDTSRYCFEGIPFTVTASSGANKAWLWSSLGRGPGVKFLWEAVLISLRYEILSGCNLYGMM